VAKERGLGRRSIGLRCGPGIYSRSLDLSGFCGLKAPKGRAPLATVHARLVFMGELACAEQPFGHLRPYAWFEC